MKSLTKQKGLQLVSHLKEEYETWYTGLIDKSDTNNWDEFVTQSVKVNNDQNGTQEDFVFIAEDAVNKLPV